VRFVGRLSDADLVNSYRTADVVVMPSQALEGFGLTTAEALACGTPVVGTPIGATPELLGCIDSALVAADATPQGIAAAVTNLFADTELLAAIRLKLADGGTGNLSWQSVAPRYLEEYRRFAAAQSHG
jgi:glycosyltransferase involved in cell wall biosynthesis